MNSRPVWLSSGAMTAFSPNTAHRSGTANTTLARSGRTGTSPVNRSPRNRVNRRAADRLDTCSAIPVGDPLDSGGPAYLNAYAATVESAGTAHPGAQLSTMDSQRR
ncbi:hypothetical protein GCM10010483_68850 [Actinokineospora diospyrosa]